MRNSEEGPEIDSLKVVQAIYESVRTSGKAQSRHLVRLIPLQVAPKLSLSLALPECNHVTSNPFIMLCLSQRTCFAGIEEITTALAPMLVPLFGPDAPPCSYMVCLKRRNNDKFDRDALIFAIGKMVPHPSKTSSPIYIHAINTSREMPVVSTFKTSQTPLTVDDHQLAVEFLRRTS